MTNHVHLLVTPAEGGCIGRMMQSLGRHYVRDVKHRYHRTGTLWEGRYKACLVAGDAHLLQCHRHIELNPLRAAMVADPRASYRRNAFQELDLVVKPPPISLNPVFRTRTTMQGLPRLRMDEVSPEETDAIRVHLQRQRLNGPDRFHAIEAQLGRSGASQSSWGFSQYSR